MDYRESIGVPVVADQTIAHCGYYASTRAALENAEDDITKIHVSQFMYLIRLFERRH